MQGIDQFPSITYCGFFIHEGETDNASSSDRSNSSYSSKLFSVGDQIKQYIVMPKYGPSLRRILSITKSLTEDDICKLGVSILHALEELYSKGLVYNNLTPNHVLIGDHFFNNKEDIKLVDFSRAREFVNEKGEIIKDDGIIYNPSI